MAGKKDRPALFELVGKGPLKPDENGAIKAPSWFYGTETEQKEKAKIVAIRPGQTTARPQQDAQTQKLNGTADEKDQKDAAQQKTPVQRWKFNGPLTTRATGKEKTKIELAVSYWLIAIVGLALVLFLLIAYRLGQRQAIQAAKPGETAAGAAEMLKDAPPSGELESARRAPARPDVLGGLRQDNTTATANEKRATADLDDKPIQAAGTEIKIADDIGRHGQCFVLFTHDSVRDMRAVQEYFNKNGLEVEIGKVGQNKNYVLYTKETFQAAKDVNAKQIKEKLTRLGKNYNQQRPKGAIIVIPSTFAGAYPMNAGSIRNVDN